MENITQIIRGCIRNDHKCQKIIYDRFRGFALKIVFRYIYRYEKAVDVVNDGFVKLFTHMHQFQTRDAADDERMLMAWLKKILIHTSIDELRKGNLLPEIGGIPDEVWNIQDYSQDADQQLLYKDLMIQVKQLPPACRIAFNLYVIDGYSHSEIAGMMKISVGTSKSNLSRARTLLQKSIKHMENTRLCRI